MTSASEVVVFGATQGERAFGATTDPGGATNDLMIARLSAVTGEVLGTQLLGGGGNDLGRAVVVADDGGLFIGGQFSGEVPPAAGRLDVGDAVLTSHGDFDALLARLAPDGRVAWARSFGGPGFDVLKTLTRHPSGDLLAVGAIQRPADYGDDFPFFTLGFDSFLARYSPAGELAWRRDFLGEEVQAHAVAVDPVGRIWVVGHFSESVAVGDRTLRASGEADVWAAAFATDGTVLWASAIGGAADERGYAVTATAGGISIVGLFDGRTTMCGEELDSAGKADAYLLQMQPRLPPPAR